MLFLFLIFFALFVGLFLNFIIKSAKLFFILFTLVLFSSMSVVVFRFLYMLLGLKYSKYSLNKLLFIVFSFLAISLSLCFLNIVLSAIDSSNFGFISGSNFVFFLQYFLYIFVPLCLIDQNHYLRFFH